MPSEAKRKRKSILREYNQQKKLFGKHKTMKKKFRCGKGSRDMRF